MEFSTEKIYLILEDYFNPSQNRVLFETKSTETEGIEEQIDLNKFVGKGVTIYLCVFFSQVSDEEVDDYSIVLERGKSKYGFQINEILRIYPLIEGEFTPGIYMRERGTQFYKLEDIESFSDEYSDIDTIGVEYDEYKLVCSPSKVEIVLVDDERETILETVIRHPFTYFDLFCPFCSQQVMECEPFADGSMRCWMREIYCEHYVGGVERVDDKYNKTELNALKTNYKLDNGELYLLTDAGWKKPFLYIPPYDPINSFWGKSGGNDYTDVFLFFESEKIILKEESSL